MTVKSYIAEAPSNIAFLKYWGKLDHKNQWPSNNSLSMTLNKCHTRTSSIILDDGCEFEIYLDQKKIVGNHFYKKVIAYLTFLKQKYHFKPYLRVKTTNNFPTASGVASSASGFAALTLSALAAWTDSESLLELKEKGFSLDVLSGLSRLGSGSSCRSFYGGYVVWEKGEAHDKQKTKSIMSQKDWDLADTVVILSNEKKHLSSTDAHKRVFSSPLFAPRLALLQERQRAFEKSLSFCDIKSLGPLMEQEALDIHSVIMTAEEPFSYLKKETLDFLVWLRNLRQASGFQAYFTIDAGSNVHVITESKDQKEFLTYLRKDYPTVDFIEDAVGSGPTLVCETL